MTPTFKLLADFGDITQTIAERLLSLKVTDESGIESDMLELYLDDRNSTIQMPSTGTELELSLGYKETGVRQIGLYTVDTVNIEGPPDAVVIRARAANFTQSFKAQVTKSWEKKTINSIVSTIAGKHDLAPVVSSVLKNTLVGRVDQVSESDMHFLTRLGKTYGAIAKPVMNKLLFVPEGEAKTATGKSMPTVNIGRDALTRWAFSYKDREKYKAVTASWHNAGTGVTKIVRAGSKLAKTVFNIRDSFPDAATAQAAANAKLKQLKQGTVTGSITLPGDMRLAAEGFLVLEGFNNLPDAEWIIKQVTHSLSDGGLTTTATLARKEK